MKIIKITADFQKSTTPKAAQTACQRLSTFGFQTASQPGRLTAYLEGPLAMVMPKAACVAVVKILAGTPLENVEVTSHALRLDGF